jgi:hypothetical protein
MPTIQQMLLVLLDQCEDTIDLLGAETVAALKVNGIKPKLHFTVIALDMHMRRFIPITCLKEKPVRSTAVYRWHGWILTRAHQQGNGL